MIGALLALSAVGCSDEDGDEASPSAVGPAEEVGASATPAAYVDAVNRLCDDLAADSTDVTGGAEPTREQFLEDQPALDQLIETFDGEVAKIPVADADRTAADALAAYQRHSDTEFAKVVDAAESGDDEAFEAAFAEFAEALQGTTVDEELNEAGISCPAR